MILLLAVLGCTELDFSNELNIDNDEDGYSEFDGDCDDNDPTLHPEDRDEDGTTACGGDCDDNDASLNHLDVDQDGYSTCDGDCMDNDARFNVNVCPTFVEIKGGTFTMGSPEDEVGRDSDETRHSVTLTHDFYLLSTEVTQGFYEIITGSNPSEHEDCGLDCPVERVNWHAAAAATNDLSEIEGYEPCYECIVDGASRTCISPENPYQCEGYRLPTEAEWEFAARFGTTKAFWTPLGGGNILDGTDEGGFDWAESCARENILSDGTDLSKFTWFCGNNEGVGTGYGEGTKPARQLTPNGYGLYDMHGNVYEWVNDGYSNYSNAAVTDPVGDLSNNEKIMRGGRFDFGAREMRAAERQVQISTINYKNVGFRIARTKP